MLGRGWTEGLGTPSRVRTGAKALVPLEREGTSAGGWGACLTGTVKL